MFGVSSGTVFVGSENDGRLNGERMVTVHRLAMFSASCNCWEVTFTAIAQTQTANDFCHRLPKLFAPEKPVQAKDVFFFCYKKLQPNCWTLWSEIIFLFQKLFILFPSFNMWGGGGEGGQKFYRSMFCLWRFKDESVLIPTFSSYR